VVAEGRQRPDFSCY